MAGIVGIILGILGAAAPYLPVVESMLAGIGAFVATEFAKLFGAGTSAQTELEGAIATAQQIVATVEADIPAAEAFIKNTYASLEDLIAKEPWLSKFLFASNQLKVAHGISQGSANKLVENAHGAMVTPVATSQP